MNEVRPVSLLVKLGILVLLAYITHNVPQLAKKEQRDVMLAQMKKRLPQDRSMQ